MPNGLISRLRSDGWFRHARGYAVVGVLQLIVDWASYVVLTAIGTPTLAANPIARAIGALFGYYGNGRYTFGDANGTSRIGRKSLVRFVLLWLTLTLLSTALVTLVENSGGLGWAWIAKPLIDLTLAGMAFLASRIWVFR